MHDLRWLLGPDRKAYFFKEIWQRRPELLVTHGAGYFSDLFGTGAVEQIIEFGQPRDPALRLASALATQQTPVPFCSNGRIDLDRLRKLYGSGQTVILNSVEDFDANVAQFARTIETEMGARVQVNGYLTPAHSKGFKAHYDTHDVLVLQIDGKKRWNVWGADCVCPLEHMVDGGPHLAADAAPPMEIHLKPGDVLYIPRGWVHEAVTDEVASLHLTLGIHPPLGKDLLLAALESLVRRCPEFREALPVGPLARQAKSSELLARFTELVTLFAREASLNEAAHRIDDEMLRRGRSAGDGHLFADMNALDGVGGSTRLLRRENMPCRIVDLDPGIGLQFLNSLIQGPASFRPAVEFVATSTAPFRVDDLPGLSQTEQQVLAAALVRDGLCFLN